MDERAEALRRRLYARDVSEEDRSRYAAGAPPAAIPSEAERTARRRRIPVAVVVLLGVLVAAAGATLTGRIAGAGTSTEADGSGASASTGALLGGAAQRIPVSIDGVAAVAQRLRGQGDAEVAIDTSSASFDGGSVVVLLSTKDSRPMGWRAERLVTRADWSSYRRVVASSAIADRRGTPRPVSTRYVGSPPFWIVVRAPAGAVWTVTVALTSGRPAALR